MGASRIGTLTLAGDEQYLRWYVRTSSTLLPKLWNAAQPRRRRRRHQRRREPDVGVLQPLLSEWAVHRAQHLGRRDDGEGGSQAPQDALARPDCPPLRPGDSQASALAAGPGGTHGV